VLEYYTFREPYLNAYAVRIFTSNAFSICWDGHFNKTYIKTTVLISVWRHLQDTIK